MNIVETTGYPPAVMADLDKAIRSLSKPRDPLAMTANDKLIKTLQGRFPFIKSLPSMS